jgi:hypothetical protein
MWQRIQTVFLVIVALIMLMTLLVPVWVNQPGDNAHVLYPLHYTIKQNGQPTVQYFPYALTGIFSVAAATLAIVSIGKFKNRLLQRKLGALNSLFMAATVFSAYYFANQLIRSHEASGQLSLGFYLPFVAVLANFLANRFILRDEKLVKDSDRLR